MAPPVICVLRSRAEPPARWERALGREQRVHVVEDGQEEGAPVPADTGCLLVDSETPNALHRLRRAIGADSSIQSVVVTPEADRQRVERELLFTPGLGEVWIVTPDAVDRELVARAADVTERRRRHRRTRSRVEHAMASFAPPEERRAFVSDAYLASLLQASPDPVLSVDAEGVVLSWNPGAERVLGYPRQEAVGKPLLELLEVSPHPFGGPEWSRARAEITFRRATGERGSGELIVERVETGRRRVFAVIIHDLTSDRLAQELLEAQAAQLEAQAAELEVQTGVLEDHAVELEQLNEQLLHRTREMEKAAKSRSRFYAAMSHELRTPINAVLGYLALVLDGIYGPLPAEHQVPLERAQRAASHLLELINDVLDLSKIEAGRIDLRDEPVRLPDLIQELLDTVRSLADKHGSEIVLEPTPSHTIQTDPRRLRQILLNLLSNAIKFGMGRPITIRWRVGEEGGAEIHVVDRGAGIPGEHLERIFEEFTQLEVAPETGTGLGLSISRQLARLLGGSLSAESEVGAGSTFRLVLPARLPERGVIRDP
jgi:PAS domain S-box-containing protein